MPKRNKTWTKYWNRSARRSGKSFFSSTIAMEIYFCLFKKWRFLLLLWTKNYNYHTHTHIVCWPGKNSVWQILSFFCFGLAYFFNISDDDKWFIIIIIIDWLGRQLQMEQENINKCGACVCWNSCRVCFCCCCCIIIKHRWNRTRIEEEILTVFSYMRVFVISKWIKSIMIISKQKKNQLY